MYGKFDGTKINYNDEDCNLIRDDDVIMIYEGSSMSLKNSRPAKGKCGGGRGVEQR